MNKISGKLLVIIEGLFLLCLALSGIVLISSGLGWGSLAAPTVTEPPIVSTLTSRHTSTPTDIPTETSTPTPSTLVPPTPVPSPVPSVTATLAAPMIPGIRPADLLAKLKQRNLICSPESYHELDGRGYYSWSCSRDDFDTQYYVTFTSRSLTSIDTINAAVIQNKNPSMKVTASFLEIVAGLPFPQRSDLQSQARNWVGQTLPTLTGKPGDIHSTSINGVAFQLFGPDTAKTLFIGSLQ